MAYKTNQPKTKETISFLNDNQILHILGNHDTKEADKGQEEHENCHTNPIEIQPGQNFQDTISGDEKGGSI